MDAHRFVDLECTEVLTRESMFDTYYTEPDEMLLLLFECWKQSIDDSPINETFSEVIEIYTNQCVGIQDVERLDSELGGHATMDSLLGIGVGFCDFYDGAPE
jgi:hypothetical protein